jgi:hypothetical protein
MATAKIGSVVADFVAKTASFDNDVKKAAANLNTNAAKMTRSIDTLNAKMSSIASAGKAFAGGFVATELIQAGKRALDYASSLGEVSQQLGVSTKALQVYRLAGSQVGIEQDAIDKGLAKLTLNLGKAAAGGKAQASVFDSLGVSIRDSSGHVKDAGAIMPELADAIAKIADPTKRATIEFGLLGKAGQQFDTLFTGGSKGINDLTRQMEGLGIILTPDMIRRADAAADSLGFLKKVLEAKIAVGVSENISALTGIATAVTNLIPPIQKALPWITKLYGIVSSVINPLGSLGGRLGALVPPSDPVDLLRLRKSQLGEAKADLDRLSAKGVGSTGRAGNPELAAARALVQKRLAQTRAAMPAVSALSIRTAPTPETGIDFSRATTPRGARGATDNFSSELDALLDKLNPVQAGIDEYSAGVALLEKGLARGAISQQAFDDSMANLPGTIPSIADGIDKLEPFITKFADATLVSDEALVKWIEDLKLVTPVAKVTSTALEGIRQLAPEIGQAFGNAAGDLVTFFKPLEAARTLLRDLSAAFTQKFVVDPVTDWVSKTVGNLGLPSAATGGTDALQASATSAAVAVERFALSLGGGGTLGGSSGLMLPGSVSGGGGFLGTLLNVAKMAAGAFGGGGNLFSGTVSSNITNAPLMTSIGAGDGAFPDFTDISAFTKLPKFAAGGRPSGLSIIGENGPELWKPDGPGTIIPNSGLNNAFRNLKGAGGDRHHHYNITVNGRMSERERRETGMQIAGAARAEQAKSARMGIG